MKYTFQVEKDRAILSDDDTQQPISTLFLEQQTLSSNAILNQVNNMNESSKPFTFNYCQIMHPNTSIARFLGEYLDVPDIDTKLANVTFRPTGSSCSTMPILNGKPISSYANVAFQKIISDSGIDVLQLTDGHLMEMHYVGPTLDDNLLEKCCGTRCDDCPSFITTKMPVCNYYMKRLCASNPQDKRCYLWLVDSEDRKDNEAYSFFSDKCSEDMNPYYCDVLCHLTRDSKLESQASYCDVALKKYCQYSNNEKCKCSFNKPTTKPEAIQGSSVCWDKNCSHEKKWLSFPDLLTKRNCKLLSCEVTLNRLNLGKETKLEINNSCIAGNKILISSVNQELELPAEHFPWLLNWKILIFCSVFLVIFFIHIISSVQYTSRKQIKEGLVTRR